jgi:hypothetical protein
MHKEGREKWVESGRGNVIKLSSSYAKVFVLGTPVIVYKKRVVVQKKSNLVLKIILYNT